MVSTLSKNIRESATMKITALANELKKNGHDVLSFSAGEPDFDTPQNIKDAAIMAIHQGKSKYTAATGLIELKEAICQKLKRDQSLDYKPENIVISCGGKHSLINTFLALIEPGDEVLIPVPYWTSYPEQVALARGKAVFLYPQKNQGLKITPQQLAKAIGPRTKLLILNSPANPSGVVYAKSELKDLARVLVEKQLMVISDEIYEKLVYTDHEHVSIASLAEKMKKLTVLINGVSKSYAMTGWRIGDLAANKEIAQAVGKIQSQMTSNPTTISQWASIEALKGSQASMEKMKEEFKKRRDCIVAMLNQILGVQCLLPEGAFYVFPDISELFGRKTKSGHTIRNSEDFCRLLLVDTFVACVPGSAFGADHYIRLSYATSLSNIQAGLQRIQDWVNSLSA
jgi:aspartate aminotransferase